MNSCVYLVYHLNGSICCFDFVCSFERFTVDEKVGLCSSKQAECVQFTTVNGHQQ